MIKTITLIRHAESQFNQSSTNDISDCDLTFQGTQQAKKLTLKFDLLIISPLKRALDTLQHSNIKYNHIIINHLFREFKINICDFLQTEEIIYETETELLDRIIQSKKYLQSVEYTNIGIITHADFIWYFTSYIINNERYGKWLDNVEHITL